MAGKKLTLFEIIVGIAAIVACVAAILVVPEFRRWVGLEKSNLPNTPIPAAATLGVEANKTEIAPISTDTLAPQMIRVGEPGAWVKSNNNPLLISDQPWEGYTWHAYVMKDGNTYKMWYTSGEGKASYIGYATSSDGLNWLKYSGNPILGPSSSGDWEDEAVAEPYIIKSNDGYKMWYWGTSNGISQIGYATSQDGITWNKYSRNPVLSAGSSGSWDEIETGFPSVQYQEGIYRMWYTGKSANGDYAIGYATSPDGINWKRYDSNPILSGTAGSWDGQGLYGARVLFDGETYKMWYTGQDGKHIGYAISTDGISWQKSVNNPVLSPGSTGGWDDQGAYFPVVIYSDGVYMMWYSGMHNGPSGIGYATAVEVK